MTDGNSTSISQSKRHTEAKDFCSQGTINQRDSVINNVYKNATSVHKLLSRGYSSCSLLKAVRACTCGIYVFFSSFLSS